MASDSVPRTTRPALDKLAADQERLLYDGEDRRSPPVTPLREGFGSLWDLLLWYQAAGVRTLGHVESVLSPSDIQPEQTVIPYLFDDDRESRYVRRRLVESVDAACDRAYAELRETARERTAGDGDEDLPGEGDGATWDEIDVEKLENPAMRPAFNRLDEEQVSQLLRLRTGFDSREEIGRWVRDLSAATNGEAPRELQDDLARSPPLVEWLTSEGEAAALNRYRFAVSEILPAFLDGARTLRGGEIVDQTGRQRSAFNV